MKRISTLLGVATATLALASAGWWALVWAADQRYIRHEAMLEAVQQIELGSINREISQMELKVELGRADEFDRARLKQLRRQREELLN